MPYQLFETLEIWKEARSLKNYIQILTDKFPKEEKKRLVNQLNRSSRAIGAQIAEDHGRKTTAYDAIFCIIARG